MELLMEWNELITMVPELYGEEHAARKSTDATGTLQGIWRRN